MEIHSDINIIFGESGIRKEFLNIKLGSEYVMDFILYCCVIKGNVVINVYDLQVFDLNGKYMTLTDKEHIEIINKIVYKTNYKYDDKKKWHRQERATFN